MSKYKVTCLKCNGSSTFEVIHEGNLRLLAPAVIRWMKVDKVISARKRLDNKFGFQCLCGQNDIMTEQEERYIKKPEQPPTGDEINFIVSNLKETQPMFAMEGI